MSDKQSATIKEMYEVLAAGSTLLMSFDTPTQAETFRIKFLKYKSNQEQALIDIGFLDKAQLKAFSFLPKEPGVYQLQFREKQSAKTYSFVIVGKRADVAS